MVPAHGRIEAMQQANRGPRVRWLANAAALALALLAGSPAARAQDIEPRAYSNAPVGVNFLIAGYAATRGGVAFDPSLPITDPDLRTSNALLAYARVLDLGGMSGKFDVVVPFSWLDGTAVFAGAPIERVVNGFGDPAFRLSVNFYGAPALTMREFAKYRQDVIVGASLRVTAPLGQYDDSRVVNIGTNRWSFKPELGISKTEGRWTLEGQAAATFYTRNDDFYGGHARSQDSVYSIQGHAIYNLPSGIWASVDVTLFGGGRTTIDGVRGSDLQQNWRIGGTLAFPVDPRNSLKLYASSGVSARTGNSFDLVGVAWQYRWGGGI